LPLHRALYVSDAVGGAGASLLSIVEILGASERNNRRDHLTGVLLCHDGRFLQAIEGGRADIDRLIVRLRRDPRHVDLRILSDQPIAARLFPDQPMGQAVATTAMLALLGERDLAVLSPQQAEAVLAAACETLPLPA
jgi:hypothetical protein